MSNRKSRVSFGTWFGIVSLMRTSSGREEGAWICLRSTVRFWRRIAQHVARVGIAIVDGKIWSSGTEGRVRTRHVRRDPRATLFVFETGYSWLGLESTVTVIEGPTAWSESVRLFQEMQRGMSPGPAPGHLLWNGQERTTDEFPAIMEQEQRLIYELQPVRAYGLLAIPS